jgi:hypothetical protein
VRPQLCAAVLLCACSEAPLDPEDMNTGAGGHSASDGGSVGTGGGSSSSGGAPRAESGSGGESEEGTGGKGSGGSLSTGGASFDDQPRCDWIEACSKLPGTCQISEAGLPCKKTDSLIVAYACGASADPLGWEEGGFLVTESDEVFPCETYGVKDGGYCPEPQGLGEAQEYCDSP